MQLGIAISDVEMKALRAVLNPRQYRQAMYQATNRTTRKLRVMAGDVIRSRLNLRKKFIDAPNSDQAAISATFDRSTQTGKVVTQRKPIPLSEFPNSESKAGVTVMIDKTRPPLTLRHAFKATVRSKKQAAQDISHEGIFARKKIDQAVANWFMKVHGKNDPDTIARLTQSGYGPGTTTLTRSTERNAGLKRYNDKGYAWRLPIGTQFSTTPYDVQKLPEVLEPLLKNAGNLYRDELGNQISRFTGGRIKSLSTLVLESGESDN